MKTLTGCNKVSRKGFVIFDSLRFRFPKGGVDWIELDVVDMF